MDHIEQTQAFANDIQNLIERYRQEFELTAATVVGTLHIAAAQVIHSLTEDLDEDS